jgi:hypothetical protein
MITKRLNSLLVALPLMVGIGGSVATSQAQTNTAKTIPVGFVKVNILAGTGTSKKTTLLSLPLLDVDPNIPNTGKIKSVKDSKTLSIYSATNGGSTGSTMPAGSLSTAAAPFAFQITSGQSSGMMFLVSTTVPNTETEITVTDPHDTSLDIRNLGIVDGDTFKVYGCDTLLSFFGNPTTTGVKGGTSATDSDNIILINNGTALTYYFNTSLNRWTQVRFGNPDASNTAILPYYGIQYQRLGNSALNFYTLGEVPTNKKVTKVKASGSTLISTYWPVDRKLRELNIENVSGWVKSSNANTADKVAVSVNGSTINYYHDGTIWRRLSLGSPNANETVIPLGSSLMLSKLPSSSGYALLTQEVPYSLE